LDFFANMLGQWLQVLRTRLEDLRPLSPCVPRFLCLGVLGLGVLGLGHGHGHHEDCLARLLLVREWDWDVLARVLRLAGEDRDLLLECAGQFDELTAAAAQLREQVRCPRLQVRLLGSKLGELFPTEGSLHMYLSAHTKLRAELDSELVGRSWHAGAVEDESQPDGLGILGIVAQKFLFSKNF
jgi:hypothetical protein